MYISLPPILPTITGTLVNCTGQVVAHGSVSFMIDSLDYHADVNTDGTFSLSLYNNLASNAVINVSGFDSTSSTPVPPYTIQYNGGNAVNAGFVFACATGGPSEFISYNLDGTDHLFIRNIDSAFCRTTFAYNRTEIACRRANGSPDVEGYVSFVTGPTSVGGTDTSSILTLHQYSTASSPSSLNIVSFTESYRLTRLYKESQDGSSAPSPAFSRMSLAVFIPSYPISVYTGLSIAEEKHPLIGKSLNQKYDHSGFGNRCRYYGKRHSACVAQAGFKVTIIEVNAGQLEKAISTIAKNLDRQLSKGSITADQKNTALSNITSEQIWRRE